MKKRILASTMASVMALSGAATQLVSSAAVADFKDEVVTRGELDKYLKEKEIVDLAENGGVEEYGTYSAERFVKAYSLAVNTVNNTDATDEEIIVAFQLLKEAKKNLVQYDKKQLAALVETCKPTYETDNILNEEYGLTIYKDDPWTNFANAYENATSYTESDDTRAVTDAYEELDEYKNPAKKDSVTKRELESAKKAYEQALKLENKFQPWQRGKVSGSGKSDFDGKSFAWGLLYNYIESGNIALKAAYQEFDEAKGLKETTDEKVVNAVKDLNAAAKILTGFSADTLASGGEAKVKGLLKKYHGQLVMDTWTPATIDEAVDSFLSVGAGSNGASVLIDGTYRTVTDAAAAKTYNAAVATPAYKIFNVELAAAKQYQPMSGTKSKSTQKAINSSLEVKADTKLWFLVTKAKIYETNKGQILDDGAGVWFYDTEAGATSALAAVATAQGLANSDVEVNYVNKGAALVLSDYFAVTADMVNGAAAGLAAAEPALETAKDAYCAVSDGSGAVKTVLDLVTAAIADVAAAKAAVSAAAYDGTAAETNKASNGGTALTESAFGTNKTALIGKIDAVNSALTELKGKLEKMDTAAERANITVAAVSAIGAYSAIDAAVQAIDATAIASVTQACADAAAVTAVTTPIGTLTTDAGAAHSGIASNFDSSAYNALTAAFAGITAAEYDPDSVDTAIADAAMAATTPMSLTNGFFFNNTVEAAAEMGKSLSGNFDAFVDDSVLTTANLALAMTTAEKFYQNKNYGYAGIAKMDSINAVTDYSKKTSAAEKVIYNYLKYALEDLYDEGAITKFGWKDVDNKVNDAYKLQETTVECALFSKSHMLLINARENAIDWLKEKDITKPYKDKMTLVNGSTSTDAYNALNDKYKQLNDELSNFKYSYEDIAKEMAKAAKVVDEKKDKQLAEALYDVADAFLKVKPIIHNDGSTEFEDSEAITEDGEIKLNNRLYTQDGTFDLKIDNGSGGTTSWKVGKSKSAGDPNHTHKVLYTALTKMMDLTAKATNTETKPDLVRDVNGDGTDFNLADVVALATLYATKDISKELKYDYDNSGTVDLKDIVALATEYANKV